MRVEGLATHRAVYGNIEASFLGLVVENSMAHWAATDVAQTDDEHGELAVVGHDLQTVATAARWRQDGGVT